MLIVFVATVIDLVTAFSPQKHSILSQTYTEISPQKKLAVFPFIYWAFFTLMIYLFLIHAYIVILITQHCAYIREDLLHIRTCIFRTSNFSKLGFYTSDLISHPVLSTKSHPDRLSVPFGSTAKSGTKGDLSAIRRSVDGKE